MIEPSFVLGHPSANDDFEHNIHPEAQSDEELAPHHMTSHCRTVVFSATKQSSWDISCEGITDNMKSNMGDTMFLRVHCIFFQYCKKS